MIEGEVTRPPRAASITSNILRSALPRYDQERTVLGLDAGWKLRSGQNTATNTEMPAMSAFRNREVYSQRHEIGAAVDFAGNLVSQITSDVAPLSEGDQHCSPLGEGRSQQSGLSLSVASL